MTKESWGRGRGWTPHARSYGKKPCMFRRERVPRCRSHHLCHRFHPESDVASTRRGSRWVHSYTCQNNAIEKNPERENSHFVWELFLRLGRHVSSIGECKNVCMYAFFKRWRALIIRAWDKIQQSSEWKMFVLKIKNQMNLNKCNLNQVKNITYSISVQFNLFFFLLSTMQNCKLRQI